MRPNDPRVRAWLAPARGPLTGVVSGSVVGAALVIGQAFAVTGLIVAALERSHVWAWAFVVLAVLVARAATGLVVDLCAARAAMRVRSELRRSVIEAVLRRGGSRLPAGEAAALATRGVAAAEPYLTRYLPAVVLAAVLPPLTVVALATQDVMSALIVLATLPLVPVFAALVGLATRDRAEAQWRALASLSGHFVDVMRGLPTLVAFRRARAQSSTIRTITDRYRVATLRTLRLAFASSAVLELVATLSVALVAVVVGVRLAEGSLDLKTALVVLLLAPEAYWPLRRAGAEFHAAAEGLATFEQVSILLEAPRAESSPPPWQPGPIEVRDLTVTYPGRQAPALSGLTATIPDRGLTVIVGPSGSGKSTLLAALMGLVGDRTDADWQARISWVPQRPTFLAGSVADNLRLAAPEATDAELWDALSRVELTGRVTSLDQAVGEDGKALSAGERARLALARAVVAGRPWLFLDEPTAHLDAGTEQAIARILLELARTAGVVVVAHRVGLIELADHVVRLPDPVEPDVSSPRSGALPSPQPRSTPTSDDVAASVPRFLLSTLLGAGASASGVALTATAGWLIVQASSHPPVLTMLIAIVGVRTFGLARPCLRYAERLHSHDAVLRLLAARRVEVYDTLVPLTPGRLGKRRGDVLASVVDDVDCVMDRELRVRLPVRSFLLVTALAIMVAAFLLPAAALLLATGSLVTGGLAFAVARLGGHGAERRAVAARAEVSTQVVDATQSASELVMWQATRLAVNGVAGAGGELDRAAYQRARMLGIARATVLACTGIAVGAMAIVTAGPAAHGALSHPMLALLVLTPLAMVDLLMPLAEAGSSVERIRAAETRLAELGTLEPAVDDPRDAIAQTGSHDVGVREIVAGWDRPVLDGVRLELAEGARVGIVGPSGSGKSTLAALLLRFIDPVHGRVELGGVPVPDLALDDVRRTVGLVDDDPHVFATTVVENVRLARPGATNAQVEEVLRRAHLGRWLDGLEHGLDTWLGEAHSSVSGGERARLGLARSLLADQAVLVLDEPTAQLDTATAEAVAADLLDGADGRSVVWITHTTTGLDRMDDVLVLAGQ